MVSWISREYRITYSRMVHALMLLKNRKINRHVVVMESDDWGSIRMPSLEVFGRLKKKGVTFRDEHGYDSVDSLASNDDLELLMEVLSSVKDVHGNPARITLNCVTSNPDFDKIRMSDFQKYYYEPFPETLKRYPKHEMSFDLIKEGIRHRLFQPQFHGREHLNPQKWLRYLKKGNTQALWAFDENLYSLEVDEHNRKEYFLEAYKIQSQKEIEFVKKSIKEGLQLFQELFGFPSMSMIAPCYTWDEYIEKEAFENGVKYIQGLYIQRHSDWYSNNYQHVTGHYFGEKNQYGQYYLIRNCLFEPTQLKESNALSCFDQICKAFKKKLPAVISCHRLNFIGFLNERNRDDNLKELKKMLELIVHEFPDVEFMSSDECGNLYAN